MREAGQVPRSLPHGRGSHRSARGSDRSRDRGTPLGSGAILLFLLFLSFLPSLAAQAIPYTRPVETAPQAQTIGGGYQTPAVQKPLPRDSWLQMLDVVMLAAAMGISVWLVLKRRNRKWAIVLPMYGRSIQKPLPRDSWLQMLDVVMLAAAMGISVWLVLKRRNRKWAIVLT